MTEQSKRFDQWDQDEMRKAMMAEANETRHMRRQNFPAGSAKNRMSSATRAMLRECVAGGPKGIEVGADLAARVGYAKVQSLHNAIQTLVAANLVYVAGHCGWNSRRSIIATPQGIEAAEDQEWQ